MIRAGKISTIGDAATAKIPEGAKVQKEASGFGFVEGPVWIKSGVGYLVFSDIPNNKIMKWTAKDGVSVFREDSKNANGNTTDPDGLLVTAQHGSRSVTRTRYASSAIPFVGNVVSMRVALTGTTEAIVFTTRPVRSSSSILTGLR